MDEKMRVLAIMIVSIGLGYLWALIWISIGLKLKGII